ncbi:MAG: helix-turn-helix domain-containing protein [Candidatus Hydrogenedentes bacterium]|nr:helix-turn-helix domain-containing protein [Candidatus Hydrogenedentota bacterium]
MPNIAKIIQQEIQRIAKKEIKAATTVLKEDLAALKKTLAEQKRVITALEKENRLLMRDLKKRAPAKDKAEGDTSKQTDRARVTGKMVRAQREKLGLSQAEFAKLVGVSSLTVYKWEHKEGRLTFRGEAKGKLVALRKLGKREARKRLDGVEGG